ncbi:MAG: 50S ribosomal protein L19 [Oligoflexales bacterium]|nr:50S ribosomal protein L19 [Oligoflexales bacterium]
MKNQIISRFEERIFKARPRIPNFRSGDTVRVHYKIQEGTDATKFRIQPFEGVVIRRKNGTVDGSFTVRKISAGGVGVERVFPLWSHSIEKVDLLASGVVRRSRLYYLRNLSGKSARIRSKYVAAVADTTAGADTSASTGASAE